MADTEVWLRGSVEGVDGLLLPVAHALVQAREDIERLAASDRWRPASLDLGIALTNSRLDQTYNTPAVATLVLFADASDVTRDLVALPLRAVFGAVWYVVSGLSRTSREVRLKAHTTYM